MALPHTRDMRKTVRDWSLREHSPCHYRAQGCLLSVPPAERATGKAKRLFTGFEELDEVLKIGSGRRIGFRYRLRLGKTDI